MARVSGARNGNAISDCDIDHTRANILDDARRAITQLQCLVHLRYHALDGPGDAMRARPADDLPDQIGSLSGFSDQALLSQFEDHLFRAGTDDRSCGPHEQTAGKQSRWWHISQFELSVLYVLNDLQHVFSKSPP